ncbi:MAG: ComEC/Rec2 family competence protein, partial [Candidatus Eiseniibacteriota bacterium]
MRAVRLALFAALAAALGFEAGAGAGAGANVVSHVAIGVALASALTLLSFATHALARDRPIARTAANAVAITAVLAGFGAHGAATRAAHEERALAEGTALRGWVAARVVGMPERTPGSIRFRCRIERSTLELARGSRFECATLPAGAAARLHDGVLFLALVDLSAGDGVRNPGGFDERRWHAVRGSSGRARLVPGTIVVRGGPGVLEVGARSLSPWREHLIARVRAQEHGRAGAFLAGFLLGDRSGLDPGASDDLRRAGALHLLAISGMHIVLVLALIGQALQLAGLRGRRAALLRLAAGACYCALAGGSASVWRAGVSAALVEAGALAGRRVRAEQALALTILLLVAHRPAFALDAGFQLSVLATWGLLAVAQPVMERLEEALGGAFAGAPAGSRARAWARLVRGAAEPLVTTIAAQLVALPVIAAQFGAVSALGLASNVLLVPVTNVALVAGVLALAVGSLSGGLLAQALWIVADAGALLTLRVASELARAPLAFRSLGTEPSALAVLALVVAAVTGALGRLAQFSRGLAPLWTAAGLAALAAILIAAPLAKRGTFELVLLDIGQGDAILARLPDGRALLIDAGDARPGQDMGTRVVVPALRRLGVHALSAVIASHGDQDHAGGLPATLRDVPVECVLGPG